MQISFHQLPNFRDGSSLSNQRANFRLDYPKADRPEIHVEKYRYEVLDLSEKGVKFDCAKTYRPQQNAPLVATVVFQSGKSCQVKGTVLRYLAEKNQCVAVLSQGVPLALMMEEHRKLLQKYKAV